MGKIVKLEELSSYKMATELTELIYRVVKDWTYLDQKTVGLQLIRSADSVAANIAEGFGRYHKKDKIKFFYNARGSTLETIHWIETANGRDLLSKEDYEKIIKLLRKLPKEINYLIKYTNINLSI